MSQSFRITPKDRAFAKKYARLAVEAKPLKVRFNDSNFHRRGEPSMKDERWYPHFIGKLGEIAYGRLTKKEPSLQITEGGDTFDFPGIEIKTRCCADENPLLIVKKGEFLRKKPRHYVLIRVDPDFSFAHVVGRISRSAFCEKSEALTMRGREVMAIRANALEQFESQ